MYVSIITNRKVSMNCKMFLVPTFMLISMVACSAKEIQNLKSQADIDNAIKNNKMVVIDYHAEKTCGPCQQMAKILPGLATEFADVQFIKVDVNEFDVAEIRSVPTFVIYFNQKEVKRFSGSKSKQNFINVMNEAFKCCDTRKK